jgi:hypothetical protein
MLCSTHVTSSTCHTLEPQATRTCSQCRQAGAQAQVAHVPGIIDT